MTGPKRSANAGALVTAGLVALFRIVAVCVAAPLVARALAAGQYLATLFVVGVLVILCQAAGDGTD